MNRLIFGTENDENHNKTETFRSNQTFYQKLDDIINKEQNLLNDCSIKKKSNDMDLFVSNINTDDQQNKQTKNNLKEKSYGYSHSITSNESVNGEFKTESTNVTSALIKQQATHRRCPMNLGSENSFLNYSSEVALKSKKKKGVKLKYLLEDTTCLDTLFQKSLTV